MTKRQQELGAEIDRLLAVCVPFNDIIDSDIFEPAVIFEQLAMEELANGEGQLFPQSD